MKKKRLVILAIVAAVLAYALCLPRQLFSDVTYSTVVTDRNGELLGARIADDGQWRFPPSDSIPQRFALCCINFEDEDFPVHPGVDIFSICRAALQNIRAGRVVSGGSTITMQVIRLSRHKERRNIREKIIEVILATRLELRLSKNEILALYASHAPFGGNVVGIEAAAWRYFGRPPQELSWGESATLAVLPNSPSLLHLGRNRTALKAKRDRLLAKLFNKGIITEDTYLLACDEPLPDKPMALPQYAPHLTVNCARSKHGQQIQTAVDIHLQRKVEETVSRWNADFSTRQIRDIAAVVINVHSGETIAYCGNAGFGSGRPGCEVDAASAPRSTGSILKPLLYCAMLQDGDLLPHTLLPDIPVNINGFTPQNFDRKFYGAVPADQALARSLNVPAVHMLRQYGIPKFRQLLINSGMTTLTRPASHYGLSLILGGAEGRLDEITRIYAGLAAQIQKEGWIDKEFPLRDRMAVLYTLEALKEVNRPDEIDWKLISSVRKVAWKTGTSYGFRDAWAVGVTPDYAVGVWVGNAQGQGAPGLIGGQTAGPVMFDIFSLLPPSGWFDDSFYGEYINAEVCKASGHLRGPHCHECDTLMLPAAAMRSTPCPYHTADGQFILPPAMGWYYKDKHPEYAPAKSPERMPMQFIYPEAGAEISLPKQLDSSDGTAVFTLAHTDPDATVFWHIDDNYIATTRFIHQLIVAPTPGHHSCTVVDQDGNSLSVSFTIK